jgi:hypothetical protein
VLLSLFFLGKRLELDLPGLGDFFAVLISAVADEFPAQNAIAFLPRILARGVLDSSVEIERNAVHPFRLERKFVAE